MKDIFSSLKSLKDDMILKKWTIDAFDFNYKQQNYIVLVKLYDKKESRPKFALLKLEFLKADNFNIKLTIPANSSGLIIDTKKLRSFFNIDFSKNNLGSILQQFDERLATFIPARMNNHQSAAQKNAKVISLSNSDSEDPNKVYCFAVKRNSKNTNGKQQHRSIYNGQKTRLLRHSLYEMLGSDNTLSFIYYDDPQKERSDNEIVKNWETNQNK